MKIDKEKWYNFVSEIAPDVDVFREDIHLMDTDGSAITIDMPGIDGSIAIYIMNCFCMDRKYRVELYDRKSVTTTFDHISVEDVRVIVKCVLLVAGMYNDHIEEMTSE